MSEAGDVMNIHVPPPDEGVGISRAGKIIRKEGKISGPTTPSENEKGQS